MKFFNNNKVLMKIASIVIIMLFIQVMPITTSNEVDAATDLSGLEAEKISGGALLNPIISLSRYCGIGITEFLHTQVMGHKGHINIDLTQGLEDALPWILGVAAALIVVVVAIAAAPATLGVGALLAIAGKTLVVATAAGLAVGAVTSALLPEDNITLPRYTLSAEEIFKGKIPMLDVNFFNPRTDTYDGYVQYEVDSDAMANQSIALEMQNIISGWYVALRNIALILMMSILLYIGIKILLSSLAMDKAKYKELLVDWIVGISLLLFMHYIMVFSVTIVEMLTDVIGEANSNYYLLYVEDADGKLKDALDAMVEKDSSFEQETMDLMYEVEGDTGYLKWYNYNIMSRILIESQLISRKCITNRLCNMLSSVSWIYNSIFDSICQKGYIFSIFNINSAISRNDICYR